jgi:hypothetical protein
VYGFEVPNFNGSLQNITGSSKWLMSGDGKYIPLDRVSTKDLDAYNATTKRLDSTKPIAGARDWIQFGGYIPDQSQSSEEKKPGFFKRIWGGVKNFFTGGDNKTSSAGPAMQDLSALEPKSSSLAKAPNALMSLAPARLPEIPSIPNQPSPFAAFNVPKAPVAGPMSIATAMPQPTPMPLVRFGAQPNMTIANGFNVLQGGIASAAQGPQSFNSFYDANGPKKLKLRPYA